LASSPPRSANCTATSMIIRPRQRRAWSPFARRRTVSNLWSAIGVSEFWRADEAAPIIQA
jgi:hypothetical protein